MMSINTITVNAITVIKTTAKNAVDNAFRVLFLLLPLAGALLLFSCNQDDIFYQVENETALKDPLIQGGPTKIVKLDGVLYVASAKIWKYEGGWSQLPGQPGGVKVLDLAVTDGHLYAVIDTGVDLSGAEYWRFSKNSSGNGWDKIDSPAGRPSAIYGAGDTLFVGTSSGAVYALKDGTTVFSTPISTTGMLRSAAKLGNDYYISLSDQGVFKSTNSTAAITDRDLIQGSEDKGDFTGLIEVDNSHLIMVSTSGVICKLSSTDDKITDANSHSLGFTFTGAIAVWNDPTPPTDTNKRRLLLGRRGGNYRDYGYYECLIGDLSLAISGMTAVEPVETVESNATYKNSLGKRAINSIYQAPDGVIFASTQQDSLWVCSKKNDEGWAWNRQE